MKILEVSLIVLLASLPGAGRAATGVRADGAFFPAINLLAPLKPQAAPLAGPSLSPMIAPLAIAAVPAAPLPTLRTLSEAPRLEAHEDASAATSLEAGKGFDTPALGSAAPVSVPRPLSKPGDAVDMALVRRSLDGDASAFTEIYSRHERPVRKIVVRVIGYGHDDQDVVQEVFLQAHKCLSRIAERSSLSPWLYRVAHNVAMEAARRFHGKKESPMPEGFEPAPSPGSSLGRSAEDEADIRERSRAVVDALAQLPAQDRVVIEESLIDGLSRREIGLKYGLKDAAVRQRLRRARLALMRLLRRA